VRQRQLWIPATDNESLIVAVDSLLEEIGYYQLKVSRLLDPDIVPNAKSLDDAVGEVAKLIYPTDEAA
jgi:hypothetical protein